MKKNDAKSLQVWVNNLGVVQMVLSLAKLPACPLITKKRKQEGLNI